MPCLSACEDTRRRPPSANQDVSPHRKPSPPAPYLQLLPRAVTSHFWLNGCSINVLFLLCKHWSGCSRKALHPLLFSLEFTGMISRTHSLPRRDGRFSAVRARTSAPVWAGDSPSCCPAATLGLHSPSLAFPGPLLYVGPIFQVLCFLSLSIPLFW